MKSVKELRTKKVPIDSLKSYPGNARRGDVEAIKKSLRHNNQYRPVVVREATKEILAGNHTWLAMKEEGYTEIYATFISCTAEEGRRINLADNRTAELGGYDLDALTALVGELPDLEGTGWSAEDLAALLTPAGDSDDVPEPGDVPDDNYDSQFGVIVLVEDQQQQQAVYEKLKAQIEMGGEFSGATLKVVAV